MSPIAQNNDAIYGQQTKSLKSFDELLQKIQKLFESNEIDVDQLKQLMQSYESNPADWIKYVNLSKERYTRVLIDGGNGKYNLMLLCWPANTGSSIHDHPDSHCILKVLAGTVSEVRYCWPKDSYKDDHCDGSIGGNDDHHKNGEEEGMIIADENRLQTQNVAYINDSIGLHRVMNPDPTMPAFSLHLYSPPFDYCRIFDEKTGKYQTINVGFDPKEIEAVKYRVKRRTAAANNSNCDINHHHHHNHPHQNSFGSKDVLVFEMDHNPKHRQQQQDGKTRS